MEPQEFLDHWQLERAELARLLGKGLDTVNQWMAPGTNRKTPEDIRRQLRLIHILWVRWEAEEEAKTSIPIEVESLFRIAIERKKLSG
jgi:hypothetical protein